MNDGLVPMEAIIEGPNAQKQFLVRWWNGNTSWLQHSQLLGNAFYNQYCDELGLVRSTAEKPVGPSKKRSAAAPLATTGETQTADVAKGEEPADESSQKGAGGSTTRKTRARK